MKKAKFKSALFGFRRRQVLEYVDQTCSEYERQLQEQAGSHREQMAQVEGRVEELSASLDNSRIVCAEQAAQLEELQEQLILKERSLGEAAGFVEQLTARLQGVSAQVTAMGEELSAKTALLAQREQYIASQAVEVSRLMEQVQQLETQFSAVRDQVEQSSALVNCLNVLHDRNRALISKIAVLETRLEEVTNGEAVSEHTQTATQNSQMITSTEQLFAAVRKELVEALDSISSKIESGGIAEGDDGSYFVDMANL